MRHSIFFSFRIFLFSILALTACSAPNETVENFEAHWQDLYFTAKKPEQAKTFCERWLTHEDKALQTQARVCLASIAVYDGKDKGFAPARVQIEAGLKTDPTNFNLHLLRLNLDVYYENDFTDDLKNTFDAFPDMPAEDWLPPLDSWFKMQQYGAIQHYLTLLDERFPQNADVLGHLGMIHFFQGDLENAETLLTRGVALSPDNVSLIWNLARIYEMEDQNAKARTFYEKALSLVATDDEAAPTMHCLYTEFLSEKIGDTKAACDAARFQCGEFFEKNCQNAASPE